MSSCICSAVAIDVYVELFLDLSCDAAPFLDPGLLGGLPFRTQLAQGCAGHCLAQIAAAKLAQELALLDSAFDRLLRSLPALHAAGHPGARC